MTVKEFFGGCSHKWEEVGRDDWTLTEEYNYGGKRENHYTKIELKCSKCGDIKIVKI